MSVNKMLILGFAPLTVRPDLPFEYFASKGLTMGKKSKHPPGPRPGDLIATSIMSPFKSCPNEAAIIGRILAGYGALEFFLYLCVSGSYGDALEDSDKALRLLYKVRGENARIERANEVLRPYFDKIKLLTAYKETYDAIHYCRGIRNQYAHCQWHYNTSKGLFFGDLDEAARRKRDNATIYFYHVDVPLLSAQEEYFAYTQGMLAFCSNRILKIRNHPEAIFFRRPRKRSPPPLHNPVDEHPAPGSPAFEE